MAKETIEILVDGGKATGGPPLGPALGPTGVNVKNVVADINKKTESFLGMKVPVSVIIDTSDRSYEIEVGIPPTSALIIKELGLAKGTSDKNAVGNMSMDQVIKIMQMKKDRLLGNTDKAKAKEVIGTAFSAGVTVEGMGREIFTEIDEGKFDDKFGS